MTTYYVYDGQSMVEEMQKNSSNQIVPTATYLTGPRGPECRIDESYLTNPTLANTEGYYLPLNANGSNPNGSSPFTRGKTAWYVFDGLGSSTVGSVTSTYTYGADGLRRTSTGNSVTTYDG